jgi:class 3 adenylate cyclase
VCQSGAGGGRGGGAATQVVEALRGLDLPVRAGTHAGEVEVSGSGIAGLAVHIAARIMAEAGAGRPLVSSTVRDLVAGSGIAFAERGAHELEGVPGSPTLFEVAGVP